MKAGCLILPVLLLLAGCQTGDQSGHQTDQPGATPSTTAPAPGPRWDHVSRSLGDALAEGSTPDATTRDWEACIYNGSEVRCPDGLTVVLP